jgi:uncharacterized protein
MAVVPCNGCTACCQKDLLFLHPEMGDVEANYETEPAFNPLTGRWGLALRHKANGECIYLGQGGCTIHGRAPAICQEFDCRRFYQAFVQRYDRPTRRRMVREGQVGKAVIEAAKARLHTLEEDV